MADLNNLPCCGPIETERLQELPHAYGFDFDLHQCLGCHRFWVFAFSSAGGASSWEWTSESDAEQMLKLDGEDLRSFVRGWAERFQ